MERIRFHLDEHMDPDLAKALRRHGIDITTTVEAGLRTEGDDKHWQYVNRQRRVLITYDDDFLRLAAEDPSHPGIVFCVRKSRSLGELIQHLILIHEVIEPNEMVGRVEFF